MRFIFYSHLTFENWDYRNPDEFGIGGSETSHIEMATRLAKRGHEVISYAPIRDDCKELHKSVRWLDFKKVDLSLDGIWIVYRCPQFLDQLKDVHKGKQIYFIQQDVEYNELTEERAKVVDAVVCLCMKHADYTLYTKPYLTGKVVVSSNGIKMDAIRVLDMEVIERDPLKIVWSSSPDRGLLELLKIFQRARFYQPDLKLDILYGYDNIDKYIAKSDNPFVKKEKAKIFKQIEKDSTNIRWLGRKPQMEVMRAYKGAGMWIYPSNFPETSCITSMEAQALGAIPICIPVWAQRENVMHGIFIEGNIKDELTIARFAMVIAKLSSMPDKQEEIRRPMMHDARNRFNWERFVDQWESWALNIPHNLNYHTQFAYQIKHAIGSKNILNVGCHIDGANLKIGLGAINMDVVDYDAIGKKQLPVDIVHDIRNPLPQELISKFDCIVMGDMLEHMTKEDAVKALRVAKSGLYNGGKIVITCPNDTRPLDVQYYDGNAVRQGDEQLPGIYYGHERQIPYKELMDITFAAGLEVIDVQELDYTYFGGFGMVCQ